jgi:hypothetical protein
LVLILPFTYWFFYQYAVVARNYCLLLPLGLLVALAYPRRDERPWLWFGALALFANVCLPSLLLACGVVLVETIAAFFQRSKVDATALKNRLLLGALWLGLLIVLGWVMWMPKDLVGGGAFHFGPKGAGALAKAVSVDIHDSFSTLPGLSSLLLAGFFWLLSAIWLWHKGLLILLAVPLSIAMLLPVLRCHKPWQDGSYFIWWIVLVVIAFRCNDATRPRNLSSDSKLSVLLPSLVTAVMLIQVNWAMCSVGKDLLLPYCGAREAAQVVRSMLAQGLRVEAAGSHITSLLPYFEAVPFKQYREAKPHAFWWWSKLSKAGDITLAGLTKDHPDVIVVDAEFKPELQQRATPPPAPPNYGYLLTCAGYAPFKCDFENAGGVYHFFMKQ